MNFALQTQRRAPWLPLLGLVIAAATAAQDPANDLSALFDATKRAGPDSPVGRDLRRQQAAAVTFLQAVLDGDGGDSARAVALQHLMRMGAVTEPAMPSVRRLLLRAGPIAQLAVVTVGEVGPFLRADGLRRAIRGDLEQCALRSPQDRVLHTLVARSWSRLQVRRTRDVAELAAMLRSGNPFRIELACQMLTESGPEVRTVLPTVAALVAQRGFALDAATQGELRAVGIQSRTNWTGEVKEALYRLVVAVAPDDAVAVPLLLERLPRAEPPQQLLLVQGLGRTGANGAAAVPELTRLAREGQAAVRREAVTALGMIGAAAALARPMLTELCSSDDTQLAARARAALRQIPERDR